MTADNVEQLMDIVRALQQGEEPDPKKRKQAQQTEERAENQTEQQGKDEASEDEFEQILQDDHTEEFQRGKRFVSEAASRAAGLLDVWKEKKKQNQERREKERQERLAEEARLREEKKARKADESVDQEMPETEQTVPQEPVRKEKPVKQRVKSPKGRLRKHKETQNEKSVQQEIRQAQEAHGSEEKNPAEEQIIQERSPKQEQKVPEHSQEQEQKIPERSQEQQKAYGEQRRRLDHMEQMLRQGLDEEEDRPVTQITEVRKEDALTEKKPAEAAEVSEKKKAKPNHENRVSGKFSDVISGASFSVKDRLDDLGQKGIHSKELIMLAAVVMFVVLLLLIAVSAVRGTLEQKRKSRNVTADKGLVVTVEDEPLSWCASYPVQLRVYVKNEPVTSVLINGESCQPDENGLITVEADDWILEAEVRTESSVRKARIELEYLDGDAPVLEVRKEENRVILTAVDARSEVDNIYYAETSANDYIQLPLYQKYTGALAYKEGTVYRFYSRDKAGNCSEPVVSTLEDAESFTLNQIETSLFPGESFGLGIKAEPEGALLKNVNYESMNPEVLTVEKNGKVTAVGNGTAAVQVTAAGMDSQICTVTVSDKRTVTISTIGDCTLGTDQSFNTSTSFNAFDAVNGHDYFFQNVRDILSQDDATFANLEGTLTDSDTRENKQYAFKGDPSYTEVLTSGSVEVVTLANNHSSDYGAESLTDTERALTEAGIDYCRGDDIAIRDVNGIKTAFIGIYVLDVGMERESQVKETITRARKQGAKLVIVAFHWGSEKQNYPDETQMSLAHTAIDSGADLVVGHHPHVLQGIEKYKGKYIVYSLANFCFGGNSAPSDMDTIIFRQTFTISASGVEASDEISIIPCRVSSATGYNNYQPTPVTGAQADQIISRLNEYSAAYGQTYTAASPEQ